MIGCHPDRRQSGQANIDEEARSTGSEEAVEDDREIHNGSSAENGLTAAASHGQPRGGADEDAKA